MAKLLLFALAICLCFVPALFQDPCTSTAILAGPATRSSNNVQNISALQVSFCDSSLQPGWYRLKVDNADADLVTSSPPPGACNTFYPIWIDGDIPQTLNQETPVTACIVSINAQPCALELEVKIINCGDYRVYHLQPPNLCPSAYCFDVIAPCPAGTSSETGTGPGCTDSFPDIVIKPAVTPLLGMSTEDVNFQDLRFNCIPPSAFDSAYFYDVIWRINGDEVIRITKVRGADLPESGQLLETQWKFKYKLGMNVQCSIRVRSSENGVPSPEHHSQEFFAGLRVLDPAVELTEGESAVVRYQATVPVPCRKNFPCRLAFRDFTNDEIDGVCKRTIQGECGFDVLSTNWGAIHELKVTAEYDGMYGDRLAEIFLKAINPTLDGPLNVWANVTPQVVNVNIHDLTVNFPQSRCWAINDPHFRSFDGRLFDVHLDGEFVLYRHKTLPLEVRGFFQPCGRTFPARCICGGAVRSGTQLFVYSFCRDNVAYQTSRVRVFGCNQRQMRVTSLQNGHQFQIDLPNGMMVIINSIAILINPSPADVEQVMGLCGNFNGNKEDEYIDPNGIQHSNDCEFSFFNRPRPCVVNKYGQTWKIDNEAESYYNYPDRDLGPNPIGRCSCASPTQGLPTENVDCTNVPPPQCGTLDPEVTDRYCTQLNNSLTGRRRRQAEFDDGLNFDDIKHILPTYPDGEFSNLEWANGWNLDKARDFCSEFFRKSPAFTLCSQVDNLDLDDLLETCVSDILLSGTTDWAIASLELYKLQCTVEVRRNTALWRAEDGQLPLLDRVMHAVCPNECSFQGTCVQGECRCEPGWIGDDCSIGVNNPPTVTGLPRRGLCDLSNRRCDRTLVFGTQFARSDSLTCKFVQAFFKNRRTTLVKENTFITKASFRHPGEIVCPLPQGAPIGTNQKGVPFGYYVSVSNNNGVYGEAQIFLPFNSDKFNCRILDGCASCRKAKKPRVKKLRPKKPRTKKTKSVVPYLTWVARGCGKKNLLGKGWRKTRKSWWCSLARWLALARRS